MEQLLHYVWKYRLFQRDLKTTDGQKIEVIDVGLQNTDGGPDFFNAKIKINDKLWVGNIEIHRSSEDWYKHKHHTDKAYNSVILHVVEFANKEVKNEANLAIPQCCIVYPNHIKDNIEYLLNADVAIPCSNYISQFPALYLNNWLNSLLLERLERKATDISKWMDKFNNSWEEVFYVLLSRNFGFGINSDAFQQLALSLPLRYIQKHSTDIRQIEAMLFGQAGLLEENYDDKYYQHLQQEYNFLSNKFNIQPVNSSLFKKLRIRPASSPYIRLAQLAVLLQQIAGIFSKVISFQEIGKIRLLFHQNASEYWQTHYIFGEESPRKSKYLGDSSLDIIIINTVVPILFAYGKYIGNEELCERSLNFLEQLKPESNFIIRDFGNAKVKAKNAYESQALIQLKREYCEKRKCLFCRIGYKMLSDK